MHEWLFSYKLQYGPHIKNEPLQHVQCVSKIIADNNFDKCEKFSMYKPQSSTSPAICCYTTFWNWKPKNVTEFSHCT